jgi:predicted nuclease of predicted toxin-antitoxin system
MTKDADFVNSHILHGLPRKLFLISTGNISNLELEKLILSNLKSVADAFDSDSDFLELSRSGLIIHR